MKKYESMVENGEFTQPDVYEQLEECLNVLGAKGWKPVTCNRVLEWCSGKYVRYEIVLTREKE